MELREWQYMNKPAASTTNNSSTTGFKKRFEKLIKYHSSNLPIDVDYARIDLLAKDRLEFTGQYDDGKEVEYKISIDPTSEAWQVKIFVNKQLDEELKGTGWPELLKALRPYIVVPKTIEPEYKNLLTEWVAMNNKTSSTGYKNRFEKLINYHINHASSELESITKKDIKPYGFHLGEHYNAGSQEFDRDIIVSVNKNTDEFFIRIFVDGKVVYQNNYEGYEKVLEILTGSYMFLPNKGTQDYNELLTESFNEWKFMNPPKASQLASSNQKNYPSQEERYKRLLAQIDSDKTCSYTVNLLDDRILAITVNSSKGDLGVKIIFKPYVPCYLLQLTTKESVKEINCDDFEKVLDILLDAGLINNTDLCESAGSIADEFKLYENLF